ncbi:MAG TPA: hypothetical protein ENI39_03620 [Anaerolineae bacterium]|nr:hypothetical protein [Anaerolineae bacterium]
MGKTRILAGVLIVLGVLFLLNSLITVPAGVTAQGGSTAQPSPRPPWYATMTPTPGPTPAEPPPHPTPTATATPVPVLLPVSGNGFQGGWLAGLGAGFVLLGLALAALGRAVSARRGER